MKWLLILSAAYFIADLVAGMYHMLTDKGWNIKQQVAAFQRHHDGVVVFDVKPILFALPVAAIGMYFQSLFIGAFAVFSGCTELCHYAAHKPERCCAMVRWMQNRRLILSPAGHERHHNGQHDQSFCVMSGWANGVVDWVSKLVPERRVP